MEGTANSAEVTKLQRVGLYIDGFNLYFGLREAKLQRFYWLNIHSLAQSLICDGQTLDYTKYFTARISGGRPTDTPAYRTEQDAKRKRQSDYLDAIKSTGKVQIIEGHYRDNEVECNGCGRTWKAPEEKMTDVNIATQLIFDAFANRFDVAVVVSGDSDLVPPIREIRQLLTGRRIHVAFPPARFSNELRKAAHERRRIDESMLEKSQFSDEITLPGGYKITRPTKWA